MAAWNEEVLRRIRDSSYVTEGIRKSKVFNASRRVTGLATGANADSVFITGALPVIFFERDVGRSGAGISATIFRGPTYTGGTPGAVYNTNDVAHVDSTVQLLAGVTVTATGEQTVATSYAIGNATGGGQGGIAVLGNPLYMLPNTTYLLRITSLDAASQDFTSFISWYEGNF